LRIAQGLLETMCIWKYGVSNHFPLFFRQLPLFIFSKERMKVDEKPHISIFRIPSKFPQKSPQIQENSSLSALAFAREFPI
jgi:hypothetical protein